MSDQARELLQTMVADGGSLDEHDAELVAEAFALASPEELVKLFDLGGSLAEFSVALARVPLAALWTLTRSLDGTSKVQAAWVATRRAGLDKQLVPDDVDESLEFNGIDKDEASVAVAREAIVALSSERAAAILGPIADTAPITSVAVALFHGDPQWIARAAKAQLADLIDGGGLRGVDKSITAAAFALATFEQLVAIVVDGIDGYEAMLDALAQVPLTTQWELARTLAADDQVELASRVAWVAAHAATALQQPVPDWLDAHLTMGVLDVDSHESIAGARTTLEWLGADRKRAIVERGVRDGADPAPSFIDGDLDLTIEVVKRNEFAHSERSKALASLAAADAEALLNELVAAEPLTAEDFAVVTSRRFPGLVERALARLAEGPADVAVKALKRDLSGLIEEEALRRALHDVFVRLTTRFPDDDALAQVLSRLAWVVAHAATAQQQPVPDWLDAHLKMDVLDVDSHESIEGARTTLEWLGADRKRALVERGVRDGAYSAPEFIEGYLDLAIEVGKSNEFAHWKRSEALASLPAADAEALLNELVAAEPLTAEDFAVITSRRFPGVVERALGRLAEGPADVAVEALKSDLSGLIEEAPLRPALRDVFVRLTTRFPDDDALEHLFRRNLADELHESWSQDAVAAMAPPAGYSFEGPDRAALRAARQLVYSVADYDAADEYTFTIGDRDAGLLLRIQSEGLCNMEVSFERAALEEGRRFLAVAQGDVARDDGSGIDYEQPIADHVPPFLLSRALLRELRAGTATLAPDGHTDAVALGPPKRVLRALTIGERACTVPVLIAAQDGFGIVVVDDDEAPLMLRRTWGGECEVVLRSLA